MIGKNHSSCLWSAWGAWERCSKECGGGVQDRFRLLLVGAAGEVVGGKGDVGCEGEHYQRRQCNIHSCDKG